MKYGTNPLLLLPFRSPIAVFLGLTAIIAGILGMHFLSGSHHDPATAVTAHTSAAADNAAGESSTQHSTVSGQGLTGDAGEVSGRHVHPDDRRTNHPSPDSQSVVPAQAIPLLGLLIHTRFRSTASTGTFPHSALHQSHVKTGQALPTRWAAKASGVPGFRTAPE